MIYISDCCECKHQRDELLDGRREPSKKFLKIRFTKGICFYRRLVLQKVYHLERNGTMENFLNI